MGTTKSALINNYELREDITNDIVLKELSVNDLQNKQKVELKNLGLNDIEIENLKSTKYRPKISQQTVDDLLYKSLYQCIFCEEQYYVIHHIEEWSKSKSHHIDNLVVLCPKHHTLAHAESTISQGFDKATIKKARYRHYIDVDEKRKNFIIGNLAQKNHSLWYTHLTRVVDLAISYNIKLNDFKYYGKLLENGYISQEGFIKKSTIIDKHNPKKYFLNFNDGIFIKLYLQEMIEKLANKRNFIILKDDVLSENLIKNKKVKNLLLYQGKVNYECKEDETYGTFRIKDFEFVFVYENFELQGNSASLFLKNSYEGIVCLQINSIDNNQVKCSVLFICEKDNTIKYS